MRAEILHTLQLLCQSALHILSSLSLTEAEPEMPLHTYMYINNNSVAIIAQLKHYS